MITYKINKVENKILILAGVLVLAVVLVAQTTVFASNVSNQSASSSKATTITIVGKTATSTAVVGTITFPAGAPSAVVSNPSSDAAGAGEATAQLLHATTSQPVAQLLNGSAGTLNVWVERAAWTASVASERYKLSPPLTTTVASLAAETELTTSSVDSASDITAGAYLALYLEVTLNATAGTTGTSSITILGET